jgi:hypothetical protein
LQILHRYSFTNSEHLARHGHKNIQCLQIIGQGFWKSLGSRIRVL